MATRKTKILSIAHSYVVGVNRRLAGEIARASGAQLEVTAVAPKYFHGGRDLRPVTFAAGAGEEIELKIVNAWMTRSVHTFFYSRALLRLLRDPSIDMVHQWEEPYVLAGAQVAFWTPRHVPLVFWTAQNLPKQYPPPFATFERYCINRCAGWLACGRTTLDTLLPRGYSPKPHRIIPLGVDVDVFRPDRCASDDVRRKLGWQVDGLPVVGYLGRFVASKGLDLLMSALEQLKSPWRAMFVGAGPMEPTLREFAQRHGDRVRVCNDVGHDAVPAFLNAMDVLCAPSQTMPDWREQFGRMLIEAFACGVPVIGSDSGEIPFVIDDAGLICGEKDVIAWTGALEDLLNNPLRRNELSQRGLQRAHRMYAWPVIGRQHIEFFEQILSTRDNRGERSL